MYQKITLDNGVRIVYEKIPDRRSAALGLWIGAGSRDEAPDESGSAHFIEHMLFKGTKTRTAADLASIMDGVGGQINAFTTREKTCFYARVLDTHLTLAIDLLSDMFFNSLFSEEDMRSELGVILEEIGMYEDAPDDIVVERAVEKSLSGALSRQVLGKPATLKKITGDSLRSFMSRRYAPEKIVVALCGNYSKAHIDELKTRFSAIKPCASQPFKKSVFSPTLTLKRKATEQNHITLAFEALPAGDEKRFAMQLLSSALAGGMSSRLFQSVREKHGLCYSISDFLATFTEVGVYGISTALSRDTESRAIGLIIDEIKRFIDYGVSEADLTRVKEQVKASLVLSTESVSSIMHKLGSGELVMNRSMDIDELLDAYDAVTGEDVLTLARSVLNLDRLSFSSVGRAKTREEYESLLKN